ncbi:MAG TPA: OmpH family outer membrane protein [Isosphaeraceae bacterium]|jgi:Skp family chaperone for outer membrane proteins|nr:OmpH family outer membrane protein [Isosphaeraceae bacterium]
METSSRRSALAIGLGLGGLLGLVGRASGQQGGRDAAVRPARGGTGAANAAPPQAVPAAVFGTIDLAVILEGYAKFKAIREQFKQYQASKMRELSKLQAEGKDAQEAMQKFAPNSPDYKDYENKLMMIQAKFEASKQQAQRDAAMRETEAMATILKEIQEITAYVAQGRRLTHVIKVSNEPVTANDPRALEAAMALPLIWADPATDITAEVLRVLNTQYQKAQQAAGAQAAPRGNAPATAAKPKVGAGTTRKQ